MQLFTSAIRQGNRRRTCGLALGLSVFLILSMLAQTVLAQNTFVITDGDQVTVHTSFATDPDRVLSAAGVLLEPDDFYTTQATEDGLEITVKRVQKITIHRFGETIQVNSYGETVEALLDRLGITAGKNCRISVPVSTMTCNGLEFSVDSVVQNEEIYTKEIPFETTRCEDPSLPAGQEKILSRGIAGQLQCRASVVYVNTLEESRTVLEETVLEQPVSQIVAVGTGEAVGKTRTEPIIGDGVIVMPNGEVLTYARKAQFVATAYTHTDAGCNTITATGSHVRHGVVAVDPSVIPYGTRMFIRSNDGQYVYGVGTAEDCGGAIKGNRVDLYFDNTPECFQFGRRNCTVYFLGDANWR